LLYERYERRVKALNICTRGLCGGGGGGGGSVKDVVFFFIILAWVGI
jgi:hypothetical protein